MVREEPTSSIISRPLLIVVSGPSGVGKDAALSRMRELRLPFHYVVTATTRSKRPGESDGFDYHFLNKEEFQARLKANRFLEWANVYGNYYGVPKEEIKIALKRGLDTIVKVDVQGAITIKKIIPEAVFIFLMPPSMEELAARLKQRNGHSSTESDMRLSKAREEMADLSLFDYIVVSHRNAIDRTVSEITDIVAAEKRRAGRLVVDI